MTARPAAQIVDDPSVTEIYVNKLISAAFDGASVSLTFGVARVLPTGNPDAGAVEGTGAANVHVTSRLALSPAAAADLTKSLGKMLNTLKEMADKRLEEQQPN